MKLKNYHSRVPSASENEFQHFSRMSFGRFLSFIDLKGNLVLVLDESKMYRGT